MFGQSLKNDKWILKQCRNNKLIDPYFDSLISEGRNIYTGDGTISYGLSSCGYDLRLSDKDVRLFKDPKSGNCNENDPEDCIIDPKRFSDEYLEQAGIVYCGGEEAYFILPAHTYALGVAIEKINMPDNVMGLCIGKSTYARCGIIVNMTPVEPGWSGHLTIEISNASDLPAKIYLNEGICQILFFECAKPNKPYGQRKYQHQPHNVVLPKV